jgi:hypothetical protein
MSTSRCRRSSVDGVTDLADDYRVDARGTGTSSTLWVDAKTLLPLKRTSLADASPSRTTEMYLEFTRDLAWATLPTVALRVGELLYRKKNLTHRAATRTRQPRLGRCDRK